MNDKPVNGTPSGFEPGEIGELLVLVGFTGEEIKTLLAAAPNTRQLVLSMMQRLAARVTLMEEYLRRKAEENVNRVIVPGRLN